MSIDRLPTANEIPAIQERTVRLLMASQTMGGIGVAIGIAVAAIIAAQISGSDALSGLATTAQVLGGALLTIPIAALMATRGRRVGLSTAYLLGTLGAGCAIVATATATFWLLLVGTFLFGAATTANAQARYAAVDLAEPSHRGRQLSLVVWATTIGSVLGPNLLGPAADLSRLLGLPPLAGAWVISSAGFLVAFALLTAYLRPDPLLTARALAAMDTPADPAGPRRSFRHGLGVLRRTPEALAGTVAIAGGHVVMVSIMVMTPLHMTHGDAEVEVIGFVISMHILGMYGLSPVAGALTDRWGSPRVVLLGVALLLLACLLAGLSVAGFSWGLTAGLTLLGLGWSCTMVAGSAQLAGAVPVSDRSAVQGAADVLMGLSAATGGALAGVVVDTLGYGWLCALAALVAVALGSTALRRLRVVSLTA
ncbi:MAG: MFS transporter [Ornithinimicrobium sp.]|uniref:MFS transporter n=1 Tax=Ornithinimicrobium sp. TaxID=1977084 RepID=UPI003D9B7BAB